MCSNRSTIENYLYFIDSIIILHWNGKMCFVRTAPKSVMRFCQIDKGCRRQDSLEVSGTELQIDHVLLMLSLLFYPFLVDYESLKHSNCLN